MAERLDVIIFGATGFTGKHTVFEAITVLPSGLKWGIAGRDRSKLEKVLQEVGLKADTNLSKTPIIIADVFDDDSLLEMAKRCRIVVNCCGPYRFYGEPVVRACIEAGTHHVDVSGEPQYMETMQFKYNTQAQERGVYVVSACGFDSIPADMGVVFVEKNFDGIVNSAETFLKTGSKSKSRVKGSGINYGTWESAVYGLADSGELGGIRSKLYSERLPKFQPILKHRPLMGRCDEARGYLLPFPGADRSVVMRSQRFLYETDKKRPVQMHAYVAFKSLIVTVLVAAFAVVFGLMSKKKFGRDLLLKYPRFFSLGLISNENPSEEVLKNRHFSMIIKASGWPNGVAADQATPPSKTLVVKVSGDNPGYGATCVALLACALTILKEADKMPGSGGVLPPGAAFAKTNLISELEKHEHGMKFEIMANK